MSLCVSVRECGCNAKEEAKTKIQVRSLLTQFNNIPVAGTPSGTEHCPGKHTN